MSYNQKVIDFSIDCFKKIIKEFSPDDTHKPKHVLKSKHENFFQLKHEFKFHRWAGSLKSSQAFAYNIFSGVSKSKLDFELDMRALSQNLLHNACVDVAID